MFRRKPKHLTCFKEYGQWKLKTEIQICISLQNVLRYVAFVSVCFPLANVSLCNLSWVKILTLLLLTNEQKK